MKGLHKKIGAIALAGMVVLGGSGLSQGFVAHANSKRLSNNQNQMKYDDFQNYRYVKNYEYGYRYEGEFLDVEKDPSIKSKYRVSYPNRWQFSIRVQKGDLDKYRKEKSIIIKIENSYFKISFNPFYGYKEQRDYNDIRRCGEKYGFKILLEGDSRVFGDRFQMDLDIRGMFRYDQELMKRLQGEPSIKYMDGRSFEIHLQRGMPFFEGRKYMKIQAGNILFVIENLNLKK